MSKAGKDDGGHKRETISARLRFEVLHRDGFACRYCGVGAGPGRQLEIDHIVPGARGGKTELGNLQTACRTCNSGKSASDIVVDERPGVGEGLAVGFVVAVAIAPGSAPLDCYVGVIEAIDARGIRLTLIDWFISAAVGWGLFVPWAGIMAVLVATTEHDVSRFGDAAAVWQTDMKHIRHPDLDLIIRN